MKSKKKPADGTIRQSQVLSTFGPGSMVDLPNSSVLIAGLNSWRFSRDGKREIVEDRLVKKIYERFRARYPDLTTIKLYEPPENSDDDSGHRTGIDAFIFPAWFVAQTEDVWESSSGKRYRSRPLIKYDSLQKESTTGTIVRCTRLFLSALSKLAPMVILVISTGDNLLNIKMTVEVKL